MKILLSGLEWALWSLLIYPITFFTFFGCWNYDLPGHDGFVTSFYCPIAGSIFGAKPNLNWVVVVAFVIGIIYGIIKNRNKVA